MIYLGAECVFCGYNGPGYWQSGTHDKNCPWYKISGYDEREEYLSEYIKSLQSQVEILINSYKMACRSGDLFLKRYQILRDNLTDEEFAELCELWPELGV